MNSKSLISVVIPLFNKEEWIERCISSILIQTYQHIEILVINDGSTDDSHAIVSAIDDKRVNLYDKENGGVSSARNFGIEKAQGEYVAFIDADDEWMPKHLEVLLEGFQKFDDSVLICDDLVEIVDDRTRNIQHRSLPFDLNQVDRENVHYMRIEDYLQTLQEDYFILSASSVLIKVDIIKQHQLKFNETLSLGEDINFWLGLNHLGDFIFCSYIGLKYHRTDNESAMNVKVKTAQLVPEYFLQIDIQKYKQDDLRKIKTFLRKEYFKKAYQNRGLQLKSYELSNQVGGGVKIGWHNILLYMLIRYCPEFVFDLYRRIKVPRKIKNDKE